MANLFAHLAGRKTVGINASRGGHIFGTFNPDIASTTFDSLRYGISDRTPASADHPFGEQLTTGFVYGPEGTGTIGKPGDPGAQGLQAAINHGALAGAPWNIPATAQADDDDWRDSLVIIGVHQDGSDDPFNSIYGSVVKWDLDAWNKAQQAAQQAQQQTPPIASPSTALASAPASNDLASILTQLNTLLSIYGTLRADVAAIKSGAVPPPISLPSSAPPVPTPVLDTSALANILKEAQAGLGVLTSQGLGTTGGGNWAKRYRDLCMAVIAAGH